jgi:hypothetical protein
MPLTSRVASLPFYKRCVFIATVLYVGHCLISPLLMIKLQLLRQHVIRLTIQLVSCLFSRSCHLARRRNRRWFRRRDRGWRGAGKMQDRLARSSL